MTNEEQKVLTAMKNAGKPVRPGDIVKLTGLTSDKVSRAISELKKKEKITSPKRCFYAPV